MFTRPIPRFLLCDSIDVFVPIDGDFGGMYSENPAHIGSVRFDSSVDLIRGEYVLTDGDKGIVYIDAKNSKGAFEIPVGSLIAINGSHEKVSAVEVVPCKEAFGRIHHWEVKVR